MPNSTPQDGDFLDDLQGMMEASSPGRPQNTPASLSSDKLEDRVLFSATWVEVDAVDDGVKALEYLESNEKPNFILMDMGLPRLDGASTIRSIRQSPSFDPIEIFAISGETAQSVGIDPVRNRIAHWFQKPLEPKALVEKIRLAAEAESSFSI